MSFINRGVRNTFRNSIRTGSIVVIIGLSVALALTMLVANRAIAAKIASVKASVGNTITVSPAGARGFEGGGEPLTADQVASISQVSHVQSVNATLSDRLQTSNTSLVSAIDAGSLGRRFNSSSSSSPGGQAAPTAPSGSGTAGGSGSGMGSFTPPVTVTGVSQVDASALSGGTSGSGTLNLTSGQAFDAGNDANVAVIGASLATKNNLKVGSTFTMYGTTMTVVGIYDAGNTFSNGGLLVPLSTLQRLSSQTGAVTSASVTVDSVSNLESTTAAIKAKLGTAADVTSTQERATEAVAPLENIAKISLVSLIGALVAGAVIILLTMIMIVRERRREIGILKAIGATNAKVVGQFMAEAVTFTGLGAVVGLGIGALAAAPVTQMLATTATSTSSGGAGGPGGPGGGGGLRALGLSRDSLTALHAAVGWEFILYGLGAALLIALIGSAIPSLLIAKVRPAEVMRAE